MIDIDGTIVSSDILTSRFACDLGRCGGMCCVEGNAGAPLEEEELEVLEREYCNYKSFMTPEGVAAIENQGFFVVDEDGDLTTPLIDGAECAYSCRENGVTSCAIERAFRAGQTDFIKPVSCHLYPIRVTRFGDGSLGLNYHRWNVCASAVIRGEREQVWLYEALQEPIVRRFGTDFYEALAEAKKLIDQNGELQ